MIKRHEAKVSYGMLFVIFILFFTPIVFGVMNNGITIEFYLLTGILAPVYAFILHMFLKTEYSIENKILIIQCGFFFNKKIDITEIKEIRKTNSLLSSPAPSLDRIEIKYGKFDEIILSPKDKVAFIKDLILVNPNIDNKITLN